jgi:GNAT superfamily N-acetyltransferase
VTAKEPNLSGNEVRLFAHGDERSLLAAAQDPELELTERFVRGALGKGDVCAAILVAGQIVSFSWSAFSPTHHRDGVHVSFDSRHRYGYFAFTLPAYRGRHLPRLSVPHRDRYCVARGCTQSISFISIDNRSSIRMATANGSHRIGFAGYLKLGPIFVPFRTPGVRKQGFRFFKPATVAA